MTKLRTSLGSPIEADELCVYFNSLINRFFKILPMFESGEPSLEAYIQSLQRELIGCSGLVPELSEHGAYMTLLSILEYISDPANCSKSTVKTEVFHAINICNKLRDKYACEEVTRQ